MRMANGTRVTSSMTEPKVKERSITMMDQFTRGCSMKTSLMGREKRPMRMGLGSQENS
jgi:hypothetical protein